MKNKTRSCAICQKALRPELRLYCSMACYNKSWKGKAKADIALLKLQYKQALPFLSSREKEVYRLRAKGQSLAEIGKQMGMTRQGVSYIAGQLQRYLAQRPRRK